MDDNNIKQTEKVYSTIIDFFDKNGYNHEDNPEEFIVWCAFNTKDLPAKLKLQLYPDIELIHLSSFMPFSISKERIKEACLAVCNVNRALFNGNFIIDLEDGDIMYKLSFLYSGSIIGEDMINEMIDVSLAMIDMYNDKFLMLEKGVIDASEIVEKAMENL